MVALQIPDINTVREARERISVFVIHTPLVKLDYPGIGGIYLKLENRQPSGSFKIRCAANALLSMDPGELKQGIFTASAGNFALGLVYVGRELGLEITIYAPDTAAKSKLDKLVNMGARLQVVPFDQWWAMMENYGSGLEGGHFIHPVADNNVIAGDATLGLEIAEEMPDVETILVPFGGGGLVTGIASAAKSLCPTVRVYGCESEVARPLYAAFEKGEPTQVNYDKSSFINGIGCKTVLDVMWPLIRKTVDGAMVTSLSEVEAAIKMLFHQDEIIAEGAGAVSVAIALAAGETLGKTVCVVSGGNIDQPILEEILGE